MASIRSFATHVQCPLPVNQPVILGRERPPFNIHHRQVSRKHAQITYLDDGRCFIVRLSPNPVVLRGKLLPHQVEVEAFNKDVLYLLPDELDFEILLPQIAKPSKPTTSQTQTSKPPATEREKELADYAHELQTRDYELDQHTTTDEENISDTDIDTDNEIVSASDSDISQESSLIGDARD
ncbi:uncharacterized protein BYT42DRAFT_197773 [Radiomyces spectabilis]|uniref:uncharacterized protein n=1 Tax=Radiomyces spectabilis TaxID=64574 RepID=UPI0022209179|nr:uncharacterized protein BYT42DRAFT_197773 [Radiomyces spectabilis]KAI8391506.1 hypothetical protein BYT42DRAFT_197773 [Radiomyces spectabilis]